MDGLLSIRRRAIGILILGLLGGLVLLGGCARQPPPLVTITPAGPTLAFESIVRMEPDRGRTDLYAIFPPAISGTRPPGMLLFTTEADVRWFEMQLTRPGETDALVVNALRATDFSQDFAALIVLFADPDGNPDEWVTTHRVEQLDEHTVQIVSNLSYTPEWATIYAQQTDFPGTAIGVFVETIVSLRYELIRVERPALATGPVTFELVEIQAEVVDGEIRNQIIVHDRQIVDWEP